MRFFTLNGSVTPPYFHSFPTRRSSDLQNRIWFDEEFSNKLAMAIQSSGSPTPTATATSTPTPTPAPGATLGTETSKRLNYTHVATAYDGHTWGGDANSLTNFSISSNAG